MVMGTSVASPRGGHAAHLARDAIRWLLDDGSGLHMADHSLYNGLSGTVLALHEATQHFGHDEYGHAVGASNSAARPDPPARLHAPLSRATDDVLISQPPSRPRRRDGKIAPAAKNDERIWTAAGDNPPGHATGGMSSRGR